MTQREKLAIANSKLNEIERLIPKLERNRSTVPVAKKLREILEVPEQKALF